MAGDGRTYWANGYYADNHWNQYWWFDNSTGSGASTATSTGLPSSGGGGWVVIHARTLGM